VPIAIRGARAVTSAGALFGIRPGRVEVVVEEPIPTTDLLPADCHPLREDVHGTISRYVDEVEFLADDVDEETPTPLTNGTGAGDGASAW
jgi:hypothetical protein